MTFTKSYEVGSPNVAAPSKHILYGLPILSFGDARNNLSLFLNYNSRISNNPYYIANGFKFSLQKRIVFSDGYPDSYEDGDGTLVKLNRFDNKYAFDDGSRRIIRLVGSQYVLENPDYSTEIFKADGGISSIKDKYGNTIISFNYYADKLISVVYKGTKTVTFNYNSGYTALTSIVYSYGDEAYTTAFTYGQNTVTVSHYTGVKYHLTFANGAFTVSSIDGASQDLTEAVYTATAVTDGDTVTLEKRMGSKILDRMVYTFMGCDTAGKASIVDVTNFHGVTTRVQFSKEKPAYSYEKLNPQFISQPTANTSYYPGRVTYYNNEKAAGSQGYGDGQIMACETDNMHTDKNRYRTSSSFSGMVTLSGWLMPVTDVTEANVDITYNDATYGPHKISGLVKDQWNYFSISFYKEDSPFIYITTREKDNVIKACDFRLTGTYVEEDLMEEYNDNLKKSTGVLMHVNADGSEAIVPITDSIEYISGASVLSKTAYPITINDLMRFKINEAFGTHTGEIYYNDGRGILPLSGTFHIRYYSPEGVLTESSVSGLSIGKMHTKKGNVYVTKTNVVSAVDGGMHLETHTLKNDRVLRSEIYNNKLDLIQSTDLGVTTAYVRKENNGLIISQTVSVPNSTEAITTTAEYDANDFLLSTTDEFGTVTAYTTDPTWGVVTKSVVSGGLTVEDALDSDCAALQSRTFGSEAERTHQFTYTSKGLPGGYSVGALTYTMGYDGDTLSSVAKNNVAIEELSLSSDKKTVSAYYPSQGAPNYSLVSRYDSYGRLTALDGRITNTYDVRPTHILYQDEDGNVQSEFLLAGINNGDGKPAASTDLMTGHVTKYGYNKDNLSFSQEYDADGNTVKTQAYHYDELNRLIRKTCMYDPESRHNVRRVLTYRDADDTAYASDAIKTDAYLVDGQEKTCTTTSFDAFNRPYLKQTYMGQAVFNKNITYNKTRISRVQDTRLGVNLGNNGYSYDAMGRIVANTYTAKDGSSNYRTYTYDEFGQLVRENNEALDKTFVYEYNNIGNVTKVKEYDFTLSPIPTGVLRERNYSYDSASPDKLAAVNGNAIQYNSLGCPVRCGDKVLVWDKGRLMRVYDDVDTGFGYSAEDVRFTYDGQGRRLTKTYTYDPGEGYSGDFCIGRDTAYTYDGDGRLIREYTTEYYTESASTTKELIFLYDEGGVVGVTYSFNGATPVTYYYHKNLQGDVIAIYDEGGNIKAGYAYDAWGNHVVTNDNLPQLAQCNPFRYRGYYYDVETSLYYCNARYYSPKLCRWISPDNIGYLDPEFINGLNLYCYCMNNPIMYIDPDGHAPKWWESILWGVGIIAAAALVTAIIVCSGGSATPFLVVAGQAALGGLKIAAVAGATAGIVRAGKTAIEGGDLGDVGKSLVLGFSDGFLAGSVYAAGSMLLGAMSFRISGLINNGRGWASGIFEGGYQTPNTPGISFVTLNGGVNGGRSFGFDLDIYNAFHFHYKLGEKVNNPFLKKILGNVKRHRWVFAPIMIGVGVGLSDGWSEW